MGASKRGGDDRGPPSKRGRGGGGGNPPVAGRYAFKLLCPDVLVSAVLGSSGSVVGQLQEQSGCHFNFSRRNEFWPQTRLRTLVVSGPDQGSVMTALDLLLDEVLRLAEEEKQAMETAGSYLQEDGDFIDVTGEFRLCVALTEFAASGGEADEGIGDIQEDTNVRLFIDDEVHDNHQLVVLAGTRDQISGALDKFNGLTQACVDEPWFAGWADQRQFSSSGGEEKRSRRGDRAPRARGEGGGKKPRSACGNTIFVGGLSQSTDSNALRSYFEKFGEVTETDVKKDLRSRRSKGFGFVNFRDQASVQACLADAQSHTIDGKWVEVKRYEQSGGGSGGADRRDEEDRLAPAAGRRENGGRGSRDSRPPPSGSGGGYGNSTSNGGGYGASADGYSDRDWEQSRGSDNWRGAEASSASSAKSDLKWFSGLVEAVPADYLGLDYCITCSLPSARCGALIGRRGENVNEVERKTGTKVQISKKEEGSEHRSLSIIGPILSVYAAHLLLMRDYNDRVQKEESREAEPPPQQQEADRKIEELQKQIESLKQQMGGGGGKGRR